MTLKGWRVVKPQHKKKQKKKLFRLNWSCVSFFSVHKEIQQGLFTCDRRPRWLSLMRRPTGDQEVAGSTPAEVGNILS